jgi:hypothetical protein
MSSTAPNSDFIENFRNLDPNETAGYSPSTILAMMLRWISLEPP